MKDKIAFFAQYLGCPAWVGNEKTGYGEMLISIGLDGYVLIKTHGGSIEEPDLNDCTLLLRSLDKITDGHLKELASILGLTNPIIERCFDKGFIKISDDSYTLYIYTNGDFAFWKYMTAIDTSEYYIQCVDFLRSRSCILPFRQYSIEELIKNGWAKIID